MLYQPEHARKSILCIVRKIANSYKFKLYNVYEYVCFLKGGVVTNPAPKSNIGG